MPRGDNLASIRKIDKDLNKLSSIMDNIYRSTYITPRDSKLDTDQIFADIDDSLDNILTKINQTSASSISNLYLRLQNKDGIGMNELNSAVMSLFDDNRQIVDTVNFERIRKSIQSEDYQIDLICRYMPVLERALDIKKDNVLSSDNFTKEFLNFTNDKSSKKYLNQYQDRCNALKEKYNIPDFFDEIYYECSKYGEAFIYHVPYTAGFERLLRRKSLLGLTGVNRYTGTNSIFAESTAIEEQSICIFESSTLSNSTKAGKKLRNTLEENNLSEDFIDYMSKNNLKINLFLDESGIIPEPIEAIAEAETIKSRNISLTESFLNEGMIKEVTHDPYADIEPIEEIGAPKGAVSKDIPQDKRPINDFQSLQDQIKNDPRKTTNNIPNDGLIDPVTGTAADGKQFKVRKDINGSVMYKIPRSEIFPVYIEDIPLGYVRLMISNNFVNNLSINGYNTYNTLTNTTKMLEDEYDRQNDMFVSYLAGIISDQIDAKFINANIDLKEQIYAILRYNDKFCTVNGVNNISVTFIPAEDIHHCYFKLNKKTHRGISDLDKAIVPAMMYCMLYLNDIINKVSRAQDKRVYYVKQTVETNVARTLLNVITQIKKGNMNMRQLENMNTIFNVIGKYNDYIIPQSQQGEAPMTMEVMQGQQVDTPTDLMDAMKNDAVESTDVPLEWVNSTMQVDYAMRFTMSNSTFMRKVFKRQYITQTRIFTPIFRKCYNYEYLENDQNIKVELPAPMFLMMTNSQQLIENVQNYVTSIDNFTNDSKDDNTRSIFRDLMMRKHLSGYINFPDVDETIREAEHIANQLTTNEDDTYPIGDEL